MIGAGTQTIETERLILREFTLDDVGAMFRNWTQDPDVTRFLRWAPHSDEQVTTDLVKKWMAQYGDSDYYHWVIALKESNMPIGSIGILNVSVLDESGEIGYAVGKPWWGQGYTAEATKTVIAFAFEQVGFHRLEAYHSVNNPASGRVMQKCGMTLEGRLRHKYKCSEGFQDCDLYAILNETAD